MMAILMPVLIVAGIGLLAGIGLSVASVIMAVPVDEKAEAVRAVLPGANCGACGYSGCDAYAKALSEGAKVLTLCAPGGADVAAAIGQVLGMEAGAVQAQSAVVRCRGNCDSTKQTYDYDGINSCQMASQLLGGPGDCKYGCIGLGDCAAVCEHGALKICNGVAIADPALCKACRKCVNACPKGLIHVTSVTPGHAYVYCMNREKGGQTRKKCTAGCIGCMKCKKVCESGAISVNDNLAKIDRDKCTGCGKCAEQCPNHCIEFFN